MEKQPDIHILKPKSNLNPCGCYVVQSKALSYEKPQKPMEIPLKHIDYVIELTDGLANVTLLETYFNPLKKYLEIDYSFPINPQICIYQFGAEFGTQKIYGIVKEKQQAKKEYKQAVQQHKQAVYAEIDQTSTDIMNMKIGNLSPGGQLKVKISYLQQLTVEQSTFYHFHIPSTISPSFMNKHLPKMQGENKPRSQYTWTFKISVFTSRKLTNYFSESHKLDLIGQNEQKTETILCLAKEQIPNKDLSLLFTVEDFHLPSYVLGRNDASCTAMLSFIPKFCQLSADDAMKAYVMKRQLQIDISAVKAEYVFLLDRSGSMIGNRILKAKEALILFLQSLPQDTYFNIVSFGDESKFMFKSSVKYNKKNFEKAVKKINKMRADMGGTQIYTPLIKIFESQVINGYPKQVFLLTDGGVSNTAAVINLIKRQVKHSRCNSIGIGNECQERLIKGCAQKGKGKYTFITDEENPSQKIIELLYNTLTPVIDQVTLIYDKNLVQSIVPNPESLPFILKNEVINFYITFKSQLDKKVSFTFGYKDSKNKLLFQTKIEINPESQNMPWVDKMAHNKIIKNFQMAVEQNKPISEYMYYDIVGDVRREAIKLSVKHQILCEYTAFLCVNKELVDGKFQQIRDTGLQKVIIQHAISEQYNRQPELLYSLKLVPPASYVQQPPNSKDEFSQFQSVRQQPHVFNQPIKKKEGIFKGLFSAVSNLFLFSNNNPSHSLDLNQPENIQSSYKPLAHHQALQHSNIEDSYTLRKDGISASMNDAQIMQALNYQQRRLQQCEQKSRIKKNLYERQERERKYRQQQEGRQRRQMSYRRQKDFEDQERLMQVERRRRGQYERQRYNYAEMERLKREQQARRYYEYLTMEKERNQPMYQSHPTQYLDKIQQRQSNHDQNMEEKTSEKEQLLVIKSVSSESQKSQKCLRSCLLVIKSVSSESQKSLQCLKSCFGVSQTQKQIKSELAQEQQKTNQRMEFFIQEKAHLKEIQQERTQKNTLLQKIRKDISQKKTFIQVELEKAQSTRRSIRQKIINIPRQQIDFVRLLTRPHSNIIMVMKTVYFMCKKTYNKNINFMQIRYFMMDNFIDKMLKLNIKDVPNVVKKKIQCQLIHSPDWRIQYFTKTWNPAGVFAEWIETQLIYSDILVRCEPLQKQIQFLEEQAIRVEKQLLQLGRNIIEIQTQTQQLESQSKPLNICHENKKDKANQGINNTQEIDQFANNKCTKLLLCGHKCQGVKNEALCLPCLKIGCCQKEPSLVGQSQDTYCQICFVQTLAVSPVVQSKCGHAFHFECLKKRLQIKWASLRRINFNFCSCPICKQWIQLRPDNPLCIQFQEMKQLYDLIGKMALERLQLEDQNLQKLTTQGSPFYNKPLEYARELFTYLLCFKCKMPFFGGRSSSADNMGQHNVQSNSPGSQFICPKCCDIPIDNCSKHGYRFIDFKCKFCCSYASRFIWGNTHFCQACHYRQCQGDYVSKYAKNQLPKCNGKCPLGGEHGPNGEEKSLGCAKCKFENKKLPNPLTSLLKTLREKDDLPTAKDQTPQQMKIAPNLCQQNRQDKRTKSVELLHPENSDVQCNKISINEVIGQMNVDGSFESLELLKKLFPITHGKILEEGSNINIQTTVLITYAVAKWIEKYHPEKQYILIVKKAISFIKRSVQPVNLEFLDELVQKNSIQT